ncbi:hypothetical protein J1N35_010678 [Gossypium stocksii]|uniref:Uncharacterized protein n=1 Tax=Gossypium stocksii TaxID=47602 RepID=A0A9D3W2P0_9ROSI|nr:hypothetical protein J1N35_010678 [Gossypium stocksii]
MLESSLYYKDVLDYWGQRDKDYQISALSNEEWRDVAILYKFLKVFYDVTCVFLNKKSKSTSSSLAESSNVLNKDCVDSSLHQHNVNSVDFGGEIGCKNDDDDEDDVFCVVLVLLVMLFFLLFAIDERLHRIEARREIMEANISSIFTVLQSSHIHRPLTH